MSHSHFQNVWLTLFLSSNLLPLRATAHSLPLSSITMTSRIKSLCSRLSASSENVSECMLATTEIFWEMKPPKREKYLKTMSRRKEWLKTSLKRCLSQWRRSTKTCLTRSLNDEPLFQKAKNKSLFSEEFLLFSCSANKYALSSKRSFSFTSPNSLTLWLAIDNTLKLNHDIGSRSLRLELWEKNDPLLQL